MTRGEESWRRAMGIVEERRKEGSKKRYRVYGYRIDTGWWAYSVRKIRESPPPPARKGTGPVPPMTREVIDRLSRELPRCAARASAQHGGNSKLAFPNAGLARRAAEFTGSHHYKCPLPAPAIGEHWHISTKGKRRPG